MQLFGIALIGLGAGLAAGFVLAMRQRAVRGRHAHDTGLATSALDARLEAQSAEIRRLADASRVRDAGEERLHQEMRAARHALDELRIREQERRARDGEHAEVVRRLATVLAGGSSKGRAGENVLREHLAELPPGMLVSDFRVNGKVVEYGLLLPDGRRLPVDSKWTAVRELEALEAATDPARREALVREVERVVVARAREVAQYLDPGMTAPVAVAAIPDAAYAVLRRAHAEAFGRGVVIVPYSAALPVLLFLYSLVARFGSAGDIEACLTEVSGVLEVMEGVLENKVARAATMLSNGADEIRSQLGKARGSVARARAGVVEPLHVAGEGAEPLPFVGRDGRGERPEIGAAATG
ncbi:MAG TPA: DNA recombination protein RmuC [Actinomycetota bacterium]|nr:DNA recombination protein RmuC [Actinomycetota bacterium]